MNATRKKPATGTKAASKTKGKGGAKPRARAKAPAKAKAAAKPKAGATKRRKPASRSRRKPKNQRGFFRRWGRRFVFMLLLLLLLLVAAALLYRHHVIVHPGAHLERDRILAVISQETAVYYRDGETTLGVFFDEEHRQYVPFEEMPPDFVQALVSSEDHRFWNHSGFDWVGLTRAMVHNIQAGRVVEGGSTLTQQTAENLFFAQRAFTFKDKAHEAVDALRLEHHYTKEDIFEFYANQFYVNGNGRGLGIAARYFFDKDVSELDTLECAFLAGVVQGPSRFDPFIGSTEEKRQSARQRSRERAGYVLTRMVEDGYLDAEAAEQLKQQEIPFDRGRFRYPYGVVLDSVARELGDEIFLAILEEHGIDNPSTAGIEIVTTIDAQIQDEALYGLRHHLTEVGIPLEGTTLDGVTYNIEKLPRLAQSDKRRHTFHRGRIVSIDTEARTLRVDLGGVEGVVDAEGTTRLATLLERAEQKNRWAEANRKETRAVLGKLKPGQGLTVSIREIGSDELVLDVEVLSELQGAVVVLEDGAIRAMIGGNTNRDFNRATQARRQFGSTFKPLVYYAALQLGWSLTDALDNRRDVFPFEGSYYYPRPDHKGAPEQVGLAWAGVHSENLASVWLLYHLTDHLNEAQFEQVVALAGLTKQAGESRDQYIERIRDREGILPTEERIREGLFATARDDAEVDLMFDGRREEAEALRRLHYGLGFTAERARQNDASKRAILGRSFLRLEERAHDCKEQIKPARDWAAEGGRLGKLTGLYTGEFDGERAISCGDPGDGWVALDRETLERWADGGDSAEPVLSDDRVLVNGQVSLATLATIRGDVEQLLPEVLAGDPYSLATLALLRDFRTLVSMRYVIALAREMGVRSELATGLSLPLGSSDISLLELALIYQALQQGQVTHYDDEPGPGGRSTAIIAELRLRDGTVLYQAEPQHRALTDKPVQPEVFQILRNVVLHGTGRRAASGMPGIPLAGKTGTTNSYRNAAFAGIVPGPTLAGWSPDEGMVVASYVGFDDNRKMSRGSIRIAGATGSLPAWLGAAEGIRSSYGRDHPTNADMATQEGMTPVEVDAASGLPEQTSDERVILYCDEGREGRFLPFQPWSGE